MDIDLDKLPTVVGDMVRILSMEKLREILSYNPNTGIFTWRVSRGARKMGSVAGSVHSVTGYEHIGMFGERYSSHRLAFLYMNGAFPTGAVDHMNHIKDDNRWSNLREVTNHENCLNISLLDSNKSGTTGVVRNNRRKKWRAQIWFKGKSHNLGDYVNKDDAIAVRKKAEIEYGFHKNHGKEKYEC